MNRYRKQATTNPSDIAFLKSLLDSEGISYFFKGEHFMYVRPLADPVRLMLRTDQVTQTIALAKNVKVSIAGINLDKDTKNKQSEQPGTKETFPFIFICLLICFD
jgi:hypothetical protein